MKGIPPEIGETFELQVLELSAIHAQWHQAMVLFGDPKTVELLNATAPGFFRIVQDALFGNVILSLSRLLDPAATSGKGNLTLDQLIQPIARTNSAALFDDVSTRLAAAKADAKGLRTLRNKVIAHNSLNEKQAGAQALFAAVTPNLIDSIISQLCGIMSRIQVHYTGVELCFEMTRNYPGGAEMLIRKLRRLSTAQPRQRSSAPDTAT
jgi:hypothetical protein